MAPAQEDILPLDIPVHDNSLQDRIILITGAAGGIGSAVATASARAGATVILLDKALKKLEALHDRIAEKTRRPPLIHAMELEGVGPAEFLELATAIDQQFGRLDGLVHCAAMLGELSPMSQYDPELWARTLHVNVNGPFLLNQVCLPLLARSEDARLILTTDRTGRQGRAYWGAYGVANGALEIMMQTLAAETGADGPIRVNSLDPGPVNTGLRQQAYPAEDSNRLPQPEAVAGCYVHLLGGAGRQLHGRQLTCAAVNSRPDGA